MARPQRAESTKRPGGRGKGAPSTLGWLRPARGPRRLIPLLPRSPSPFPRGMDWRAGLRIGYALGACCFRAGHDAHQAFGAPALSTDGPLQRTDQAPPGADSPGAEDDPSADDGTSSTAGWSSGEEMMASLLLAEEAERAVLKERRPRLSDDRLSIEVEDASPRRMLDVEYRLQKDSWLLVSRFFVEQLNPSVLVIVKAMTQ